MDCSEKCFKSNVPPDLCVKPIPLCQVQFLILKSWSCLLESVSRKGTRLQNTRIPFFLIPKIGCKCLFDANLTNSARVFVYTRGVCRRCLTAHVATNSIMFQLARGRASQMAPYSIFILHYVGNIGGIWDANQCIYLAGTAYYSSLKGQSGIC